VTKTPLFAENWCLSDGKALSGKEKEPLEGRRSRLLAHALLRRALRPTSSVANLLCAGAIPWRVFRRQGWRVIGGVDFGCTKP
jgi:hypothetical protein